MEGKLADVTCKQMGAKMLYYEDTMKTAQFNSGVL